MEESQMGRVFSDICVFFEFVTGFKPYKYQKEFLRCPSRFICASWGRQNGKSTAMSILILFTALTKKNQTIMIVAPFKVQARLLFDKVTQFAHAHQFIESLITDETKTEITIDNDTKVVYFTGGSAGKSIKGHTPSLVAIDEADGMPNDAIDTLEPSISVSKGRWIMVSTPWFPPIGTRFDEAFRNDMYAKFEVKCSECPRHSKKWLEQKKKEMPIENFRAEYEADRSVGRELVTYFSPSVIRDCINEDMEEQYGPEADKEYVMGVDLARMGNDFTVYMIGEIIRNADDVGRIKIIRVIATSKKKTPEAITTIRELHKTFAFSTIYIDESNIGGAVIDELETDLPTVAVSFSLQEKSKSYSNLKILMEQKRVEFPHVAALVKQLGHMMPKATANGMSIQPPTRCHDDMVAALSLVAQHLRDDTWGDDYAPGKYEKGKGLFRAD